MTMDSHEVQELMRKENKARANSAVQSESEQFIYSVPALGPVESSVNVLAEYSPETSPEFFKKMGDISQRYPYIRRIRGDGACYWRCLLISLIEKCSKDHDYCRSVKQTCIDYSKKLLKLGFEDFSIDEFINPLIEALGDVIKGKTMLFFKHIEDNNNQMYYIYALKFLTVGFMLEHREDYEATVIAEGFNDLKTYLEQRIQVMDAAADDSAIYASARILGINIRIEYVNRDDRPMSQKGSYHLIPFGDEKLNYSTFFLWRPEHYDILYKEQ